jgi:hypothetical protein
MDVNQMRAPDIALHQLTRADSIYTLYYDETNNIRRLHILSRAVENLDCSQRREHGAGVRRRAGP